MPQIETSDMKQHLDNFLQEASEDDCIHDVVFQVIVYIECGCVFVSVLVSDKLKEALTLVM